MTEFWLGGFALIVLASVFVIFPRVFLREARRQDLKRDNIAWYKLRRSELIRDGSGAAGEALLEDAGLRLLEDNVDELPEQSELVMGAWGAVFIVPITVVAVFLYSQLGAVEDVRLARVIASFDESATDSDIGKLMDAVAARAAQTPENAHYQALLARYYMSRQAYAKAQAAYLAQGSSRVAKTPGMGVSVAIELAGQVEAPADAVLFVFARAADSQSRMPIAVQRLPASSIPLTLRLDDTHSMAGQKLSEAGAVEILARISANGQPGEAFALWQGKLGPVTAGDANTIHTLLLSAK